MARTVNVLIERAREGWREREDTEWKRRRLETKQVQIERNEKDLIKECCRKNELVWCCKASWFICSISCLKNPLSWHKMAAVALHGPSDACWGLHYGSWNCFLTNNSVSLRPGLQVEVVRSSQWARVLVLVSVPHCEIVPAHYSPQNHKLMFHISVCLQIKQVRYNRQSQASSFPLLPVFMLSYANHLYLSSHSQKESE